MKEMTLERFAEDLEESMDAAQLERILITRDGLPVAVLVGIALKDEEDWILENSPEFWRMIEERRQGPCIPLEDVKALLLADDESTE